MKIIFEIITYVMAILIFSPTIVLCSLLSFILWDKKYVEGVISWADDFLESFFD